MVNFAQVGQAMFTTYIASHCPTVNWELGAGSCRGDYLPVQILGVVVFFLVIRPVKNSDTTGAIIATFGVLIALQAGAGMIWGGDPEGFLPPVDNAGIRNRRKNLASFTL